jgi:hypothetical protein
MAGRDGAAVKGSCVLSIEDFCADIPRLHFWNDAWQVGGFGPRPLRRMHDLAIEYGRGAARILETGAGASTIAFLLSGAAEVTSIAPDADLFDRLEQFCTRQDVPLAALRKHVERSETCLPRLAAQQADRGLQVDLALMDGGHGWPTVFVDFCFMNAMLRKDGLLLVDDVQLHAVKEFARFLRAETGYRYLFTLDGPKTMVFQKLTDRRFMDGHEGQPYLKSRTQADADRGKSFALD